MAVQTPDERVSEALLRSFDSHPVAAELLRMRAMAFEGATPRAIAEQAQTAIAAGNASLASEMDSLISAVADFEAHDPDFTLEDLLADLVLGGGGRPPTSGPGVKIATLHKTKGLEWPIVYLLGLEEGHMPHFQADDADIPEERRLCFVGVCRAEAELNLTFAQRFRTHRRIPSRFLGEMGIAET
jgi:DNA helicase-2/ATP-dependent DNA helicase PcrA